MVGIFFSLMVFAAAIAHWSQLPMMMALTDGSAANSPMLRRDSFGSERLSLTCNERVRPPSAPDSLICSTLSSRARWYALPTGAAAPVSSRSARMTISLVSCGSPLNWQPVSDVARMAEASTVSVAERMGVNSVLHVRG